MSRSHWSHPPHSHAPQQNRSASQETDRPLPEDGSVPTTAKLAEALLGTAHAIKQWGNLCFSHAGPGLRELSVPRASLLAKVADAEEGQEECACQPEGIRRGRNRRAAMADARPGRVRMGDLAEALGVTARNVTTIVDGLEREGLLARRADPTDRRAILLELTVKGRAHVEQLHALQSDLAEHMFAALSAEERRQLMYLLRKIRIGDRPLEGPHQPAEE